METDGQMYKPVHKGEREFAVMPPPGGPDEREIAVCRGKKRGPGGLLSGVGTDEILLLVLIFLIVSDKNSTDLPLLLALVYVLIA